MRKHLNFASELNIAKYQDDDVTLVTDMPGTVPGILAKRLEELEIPEIENIMMAVLVKLSRVLRRLSD